MIICIDYTTNRMHSEQYADHLPLPRPPYILFHTLIPLQLAIFAAVGASAAGAAAGTANHGTSLFHFFAKFRDGQDHTRGQNPNDIC